MAYHACIFIYIYLNILGDFNNLSSLSLSLSIGVASATTHIMLALYAQRRVPLIVHVYAHSIDLARVLINCVAH
jgi:hypothetical protein